MTSGTPRTLKATMQQTWPIRLLIATLMLLVAGYFFAPSAIYFGLSAEEVAEVRQDRAAFSKHVPAWMSESHIVPGLDLQGGIHMVLGVDLDKAIADRARRSAARLRTVLDEKGVAYDAVDHRALEGKGDRIVVTFKSGEAKTSFTDGLMDTYFGDLTIVDEGGQELTLRVHPDFAAQLKRDAVDQTIKTINNRIDKMGVTEPSISRRGDDQVQIQLPGYDDPEEAKSLIGRTAQLEFQICDDDASFLAPLQATLPPELDAQYTSSGYQRPDGTYGNDVYLHFPEKNLTAVRQWLADKTPTGLEVKFGRLPAKPGEDERLRTYSLRAEVNLTGDDLIDARVSMGSPENPRPSVGLEFSPAGAKVFGDLTTRSIGRRLAIVLEDMVDSAPVIQSAILGGSAQITMGGNRTKQEMVSDANQLALVLKSGALPAPVQFREERSVGPSLGRDAVESGKKAFGFGALLIAVFMLLYYRVGGIIAVVGVAFNMLFVLGTMSWLGATVTLPGLAGLLLTVGMAVDANIIIMERIREELRAGKTTRSAVQSGYDNAFSAIIDANVTTFIAGFVLWQYGTGPVQNFATTLLIGTVSSVVAAIFVTRVFFDMLVRNNPESIAI
jgi:protein-export membrane protein SecD